MSSVQIGQKSYEMPPREGISIAHFLTVADIERSARYYEKVFGARILSLGDGNAVVSRNETGFGSSGSTMIVAQHSAESLTPSDWFVRFASVGDGLQQSVF